MKKIFTLLMAAIICFSICSCGNNSKEAERETVLLSDMIKDLENGAKAEANVGKATTVYGKVTGIYSEYCTVRHIFVNPAFSSSIALSNVYMPSEKLIEIKSGQYVAIPATVKAYENNSYCFDATEFADLEEMDKLVKDAVASYISDEAGDLAAYSVRESMREELSIYDIDEYAKSRLNAFCYEDDELKEYLIGKWIRGVAYLPNDADAESIEFKADGKYLWKYQEQSYASKKYRQDEQNGDWSVSDGKLDGYFATPQSVYVLSEDAFICQETLYVRVK